jgi:hypothetical protein
MFLCAAPECQEEGTVFVVVPQQEHDTDAAPLGRLFCTAHSMQGRGSGVTKFQPEE